MDLSGAIIFGWDALALHSWGDGDWLTLLNDLAVYLRTRCIQVGEMDILNDVTVLRQVREKKDLTRAVILEREVLTFAHEASESVDIFDKPRGLPQCPIKQGRERHPILPGPSCFLLHPLFADLQRAAREGPFIIVNVSQFSCKVLIVLFDQNPTHVPLHITKGYLQRSSLEFLSLAIQTARINVMKDLLRSYGNSGIKLFPPCPAFFGWRTFVNHVSGSTPQPSSPFFSCMLGVHMGRLVKFHWSLHLVIYADPNHAYSRETACQ